MAWDQTTAPSFSEQPYIVADPIEKGKLSIFELPDIREKYKDLAERVAKRYAEKREPPNKYYDKAIRILHNAKEIAPDASDENRIGLVEEFCSEKLGSEAFQMAWDQTTAPVVSTPRSSKTEMERLE